MNILKNLIYTTFFLLVYNGVNGQVTSSFTVQNPVCKQENLQFTNNSLNTTSYIWDFCLDDLDSITAVNGIGVASDAVVPTGITMIYDAGQWYGFLSSRDNNKLFRLDFGSDLESTPSITDLGNIDNLLSGPKNLEFFKEGGVWYGVLINFSSNKILRLDFSLGLDQVPTATDLGNLGSWSGLRGLDLVQDGNNLIVIVSDFTGNKLSFVDFGASILNNPTSVDVLDIVV